MAAIYYIKFSDDCPDHYTKGSHTYRNHTRGVQPIFKTVRYNDTEQIIMWVYYRLDFSAAARLERRNT